jgi:hypothetical protein
VDLGWASKVSGSMVGEGQGLLVSFLFFLGPQAWLLLFLGSLLPSRVALHASCLPGCQLRSISGCQVSPLPGK